MSSAPTTGVLFVLPRGSSISRIIMRPVTGEDERRALVHSHPAARHLSMILRTIEQVDDRDVCFPVDLWIGWDGQTRQFVNEIYHLVNTPDPVEFQYNEKGRP